MSGAPKIEQDKVPEITVSRAMRRAGALVFASSKRRNAASWLRLKQR
jgi:hypothetical protein